MMILLAICLAQDLLQQGMQQFAASDFQHAAQSLEAYTREHPSPGPAHLFLGVSRLKLGQPCEAIAPLETALRWPERPRSRWLELADAYQGCKRWEPAAKAYAQAAKLDAPQESQLLRQAAHCWRMARRYDLAKPLFESLVKEFADSAEFQFEYGDTLHRLDGAEAAVPWLEKAITLQPARAALGRALLELNRPAEAIPHLTSAAREDPALLLPLSRALRATGRVDEATKAEADYKRALLSGEQRQ